jgi:thioredoxin-dependent peroxiredoxin
MELVETSELILMHSSPLIGTTQACLFRDKYSSLTESGISVYGLSADSPKSNTTFATKQSLPYPLLCDPSAKMISAIGMKKAPKSTARGVVAIGKDGKVTVWEQAGPQRTLDAAMAVLSEKPQATPATGKPVSPFDREDKTSSEQPKSESAKDQGLPQSTSEKAETAGTAA